MATLANPSSVAGATTPVNGATQACTQKRVIVIDPGHGGTGDLKGSDANHATSKSGIKEKALTLDYSFSLKAQLESAAVKAIYTSKNICDVQVIMTRTTDVNVSGADRIAVGTTNQADIFISLHFNGSTTDPTLRQVESYYRATSNNFQTNESDDLQLSTIANDAAVQGIKTFDSGGKGTAARPDTMSYPKSLWVLRDPGIGLSGRMCRSTLLEIEYISNPVVEQMLVSGKDRVAHMDAIMLAVAKALARAL